MIGTSQGAGYHNGENCQEIYTITIIILGVKRRKQHHYRSSKIRNSFDMVKGGYQSTIEKLIKSTEEFMDRINI